jgi:ketopantoate reductase
MEIIVGEVVREAQALGVPVPTLAYTYSLLKVLQFKIKAQRNLVTLPPMKNYGNE